MTMDPFHQALRASGARFETTHGRESAADFGSPEREAAALLRGLALVDASAHRVLEVRGQDRADLLHRISTNDVKGLAPGQGHANCFTNSKGRIVDWVRIHARPEALLVIASPRLGDKVAPWIERYTIREDIQVKSLDGEVALLDLFGAAADRLLESAGAGSVADLDVHGHREATLFEHGVTLIRTLGLRDVPGWRLLVPAPRAAALWRALLEHGKSAGLTPAGAAAHEAARVASGLPEPGVELSEDHHPLESGLWSSVSFKKGCYVGQEVIARLNTYDKVMKHLVTLTLDQEVNAGTELRDGDAPVGTLTSITGPPLLDEWRGLGYVHRRSAAQGTVLHAGSAQATVGEVVRV